MAEYSRQPYYNRCEYVFKCWSSLLMLQIKLGEEVTLIVLVRMAGLVNYYIITVYVNCYAHCESVSSNAQIYSVV